MLEHLGETEAAGLVMDALRDVARTGPRTRDIGGSAPTSAVGEAIAAAIGVSETRSSR
jgi:tartrate dehydrogenase/decarboxylase / D-malate dehydrogenase